MMKGIILGFTINGSYQENNYFFAIVLGRNAKVAPQERLSLRPFFFLYRNFTTFCSVSVHGTISAASSALAKKYW